MKQLLFPIISLAFLMACSSSKKAQGTQKETPKTAEIAAANTEKQPNAVSNPEVKVIETTRSSESPSDQPSDVQQRLAEMSDSVFASIERTPCYGRCPAFKAKLHKSGYATFEGRMNVDKMGLHAARISKSDMGKIKAEAEKIGFYKFNDIYDSRVTDLPSMYIALNFDNEKKLIKARHNYPDELREFGKFLDEIFNQQDWKLVRAPAGTGH